MSIRQGVSTMEIEWLILADAAQITGGKLYLMGGGWDQINVDTLPHPQNMAIAVSFRVPWTETNLKHNFKIEIVGGDGGMGDIGYQNVSKMILQNRPNVKLLMLDTQVTAMLNQTPVEELQQMPRLLERRLPEPEQNHSRQQTDSRQQTADSGAPGRS